MKKHITAIAITLTLFFLLAACGSSRTNEENNTAPQDEPNFSSHVRDPIFDDDGNEIITLRVLSRSSFQLMMERAERDFNRDLERRGESFRISVEPTVYYGRWFDHPKIHIQHWRISCRRYKYQ